MAPGLQGRGAGLLGRSWRAAFVLDDFSLKIGFENVLLSKEGKTLSKHGHRLLSPRSGSGVGGGSGGAILHAHRPLFVPREEGLGTPPTTLPLGRSHHEWPAFPASRLCGMCKNPQAPCKCAPRAYCVADPARELGVQRRVRRASCPRRAPRYRIGVQKYEHAMTVRGPKCSQGPICIVRRHKREIKESFTEEGRALWAAQSEHEFGDQAGERAVQTVGAACAETCRHGKTVADTTACAFCKN